MFRIHADFRHVGCLLKVWDPHHFRVPVVLLEVETPNVVDELPTGAVPSPPNGSLCTFRVVNYQRHELEKENVGCIGDPS